MIAAATLVWCSTVSATAATATSISGSLFTTVGHMVPGDRQQATFQIRNTSDRAAFVRIILSNVQYTDNDFAEALTMSAAAAGIEGTPIPIALAEPCWLLTEGQVISPGGLLTVTANVALGQLDGQKGQRASASADLGISLSGFAPGALSPNDCGNIDIAVPAVPTADRGPLVVGPADPSGLPSGGLVPFEQVDLDLPVLNLPGSFAGMDPNTWRLLEEYLILIPITAGVIGAIAYRIVVWRREPPKRQERAA